MPELPEVETIRRDLQQLLPGSRIQTVTILDSRVVRMPQVAFVRALTGCRIREVRRRGKALLFKLEKDWLVVQPLMTGQLVAVPQGHCSPAGQDTRVVFELSKGLRLLYNDQRLFGRLQVVADPDQLAHLRTMGPEPLEKGFSVEVLTEILAGRKVAIKVLLMDHRVVSGIGNIYASEILFVAGIAPARTAASLKVREVRDLHRAIQSVLKEAIRMRGTTMRNYRDGQGMPGHYRRVIKVYGRDGSPCARCGQAIRKIVQGQRSTFYCPACQH